MKKLFPALLLLASLGYGQTPKDNAKPDVFEKIGREMKTFKLDTSAVPDDRLSKKIIELRDLRGGFNITEAVEYKISEERAKAGAPQQELDKVAAFFKSGNGKKWLNNAVIHIYRKQFTYEEVTQLIAFYKTSAGQKMAENFPIIMIQSLKAAEAIGEVFKQQQPK